VGNGNLLSRDDVLGRLIANRYLVEETCELTATGSSYRACHVADDRSVLLRILPARGGMTREACRRALMLAERASALPSPHVARTLDVGLVAGRWPFVVSEYSKGRTLAAVVSQAGPLGFKRVLPIAFQLASALQTAHSAGIVHGSIGLGNLWLESLASRPEWLRVMGFGLAELPGSDFEGPISGIFMSSARPHTGSPPTCSASEIRADIHALGSSLYELVCGAPPPWGASEVGGILDSDFANSAIAGHRALIRSFAAIIERCLYLLPSTNYDSVDQVTYDLACLEQTVAALALDPRVAAVHSPAPRARGVLLGEPKVIVRGG
jgi:serine/threonine-protein kinase